MSPTDLRVLLLRAGTSQAQIARDLGITTPAVNRVVVGRGQNPRIRRAIADAVKLSYSGVWGEEDPGTDRLPSGPRPVIVSHVNAIGDEGAA